MSNPNLSDLVGALEPAAGPLHDVPDLLRILEEQSLKHMTQEELAEWRDATWKLIELHNRMMARI